MQQTSNTDKEFPKVTVPTQVIAGTEPSPADISPEYELSELLKRAGVLAVSLGIELDAWMQDAWSAYVDARPGLREQLQDMQLIAQLAQLRQSGRIGNA